MFFCGDKDHNVRKCPKKNEIAKKDWHINKKKTEQEENEMSEEANNMQVAWAG